MRYDFLCKQKRKQTRNIISMTRMRISVLHWNIMKWKAYLYSEYANKIESWIAVATKNDVKLKQLTFGQPVSACGVETL